MALVINGNLFYEKLLTQEQINHSLQSSIPLDKTDKSFLDLSGYSDLNALYSSE